MELKRITLTYRVLCTVWSQQ